MSPSTCISDPNAAVSKARCAVTWPGRIHYPSMRLLPCWDIKVRIVSGRDFQKSAAPSSQNGNSSPFRRRNRCGGLSRTPVKKTRRPTLHQIGQRFGFTSENMLSITFSDICALYKQWRQDWLDQERTRLRLSIREWIAAQANATVASVSLHFGISKAYVQL